MHDQVRECAAVDWLFVCIVNLLDDTESVVVLDVKGNECHKLNTVRYAGWRERCKPA